nr:MAG TPA: hypothetical protein [Caudoviricetes sp.]
MATPVRYTPPSGYNLQLECAKGKYTAPLGYGLVLECQASELTRVSGATIVRETLHGTPVVRSGSAYVRPIGWQASVVGRHKLIPGKFSVYQSSLQNEQHFGRHEVRNAAQDVKVKGWDSAEYGARAIIANRRSFLYPAGTDIGTYRPWTDNPVRAQLAEYRKFGRHTLTHWLQHITGFTGGDLGLRAFGEHEVQRRRPRLPNELQPEPVQAGEVGRHTVKRLHKVSPLPASDGEVGFPWLHPNGQWFPTEAIPPGAVGGHEVKRGAPPQYLTFVSLGNTWTIPRPSLRIEGTQTAGPTGVDLTAWGEHKVEGKQPRQYLLPAGWESLTPVMHRTKIRNKQETLKDFGLGYASSYVSPNARVWLGRQYITVEGAAHTAFGHNPEVAQKTQWVNPSSWWASDYSFHTHVWLYHAYVQVGGFANKPAVGTRTDVRYRDKWVKPEGWLAGDIGQHAIAYDVQQVRPNGFGSSTFGGHALKRPGTILPAPIAPSALVGDHHVNLPREIRPTWTPASAVGKPRFWPGRLLQPEGFSDTRYGKPRVVTGYQIVDAKHKGIEMGLVGEHTLRLRNQTITPYHEQDALEESVVSEDLSVIPRDFRLRPAGWRSERWGYHRLTRTGDQIKSAGWDSLAFPEQHVGHRVRYIAPLGWQQPDQFNRWTSVGNLAWTIAPLGFTDPAVGRHWVKDAAQHIRFIPPIAPPNIPEHWVSHGVRTIAQFHRASDDFERIGPNTDVRLNPYPITPKPIRVGEPGVPALRLHRDRISPRQHSASSAYGLPRIRLRDSYVTYDGWVSHEMGRAMVRLRDSFVRPEGWYHGQWFTPLVRDSRTWVNPKGWNSLKIDRFTTVQQRAPLGPHLQRIDLFKRKPDGSYEKVGYGWDSLLMGRPLLPTQYIYPDTIDPPGFGRHRVTANQVFPKPILEDSLFGVPSLTRTRTIVVRSFDREKTSFGKPRLSPFYIWAPTGDAWPFSGEPEGRGSPIGRGSPERWTDDPPGRGWDGTSSFPWFGYADVAHRHRRILAGAGTPEDPGHVDFGRVGNKHYFGRHFIENTIREITPKGIHSWREGFPTVSGGIHYIELEKWGYHDGIANGQVFGEHRVWQHETPAQPGAAPEGFVATVVGGHTVENQNRTIYPRGISHTGNPQLPGSLNPFGTPTIGWPRTFEGFGGFDSATIGNHIVQNWIRHLRPEGWISCSLEDQNFDDFVRPMRVTRLDPPSDAVIPWGHESSTVGTPSLDTADRGVRVFGIGGMPPPAPRVRGRIYLAAQGFGDTLFGDVRRVIPGTVQAIGVPSTSEPSATLSRRVRPVGALTQRIGRPATALHLQPTGVDSFISDSHVVSNPFNCDLLVLPAVTIPSPQYIGAPRVIQR